METMNLQRKRERHGVKRQEEKDQCEEMISKRITRSHYRDAIPTTAVTRIEVRTKSDLFSKIPGENRTDRTVETSDETIADLKPGTNSLTTERACREGNREERAALRTIISQKRSRSSARPENAEIGNREWRGERIIGK
jgi:hypothetical protein